MASLLPLSSFGVRRPLRAAFAAPPPISSGGRELRIPYEMKEGQSRVFHRLPSGLAMEAIVHRGSGRAADAPAPPLVFVHGSFHAAWCWAEHWLPFFSGAGHDCYAISLLAQGESDAPSETVAGTLQTHTNDIANFIREEVKFPPVLIGHSFGGLIVQAYVANFMSPPSSSVRNDPSILAGAVLLCSTPPSGNSGLIWRYLFTRPIDAVKVTRSLAAKAFATSLSLCKETFFSSTMDDHLVKRYQDLMKGSSTLPLFDLRKLNGSLPVPSVPKDSVPILVVGARNDFIVDMKGIEETSRFYGVDPVILEGVAHDAMLDTAWEKGAQAILSWLRGLRKQARA